MKTAPKVVIKLIGTTILLTILIIGAMFLTDTCPPQGPWIMPPWCNAKNTTSPTLNKEKKNTKIKEEYNPSITKKGFQKGIVFGAMKWSKEEKRHINHALNTAEDFDVEWIAIVPEWFVTPNVNGSKIQPLYEKDFTNTTGWITPSLTDEELIKIINKAKRKGIKIVIKPHIDPIDFGMTAGSSRGSLHPNDWNTFFTNYENFILHYADLAEEQKADMLIIGTELDTVVRDMPNANTKWHSLINKIREKYSGPITYSASCYNECWSPRQVTFWDDLDYIGFEPYFAVTSNNDPTIEELKAGFDKKLNKYAKPLHTKYNKPVLITEANVYSYDGVNKHPLDPPKENAKADFQEQSDYYDALMQSIIEKDWINGIYWWGWYLSTSEKGDYSNDLYDPFIHKKAGKTLSSWYKDIATE